MTKPLTIWCNAKFPADVHQTLAAGIAPRRLLMAQFIEESNLAGGQPDSRLAEADIVFGQVDPAAAMSAKRLKWIHLTTAGYERYDREDFRRELRDRGGVLTNSSSVYAEPCAHHALAMMLAIARQIPRAMENQRAGRKWPAAELRRTSQVLTGHKVVILGYGAIGRRLAELLGPFRAEMIAVRRSVKGDEPVKTKSIDELDRLLPDADHVVSTLPGGEGTARLMNAQRFARMKPSSIFYNIGRGSTVDQDALLEALRQRRIAAAFLDVTEPEPLPPEHPLWAEPNCYITPHTAGGQVDEGLRIVEHFLGNLRAFVEGRELRDRVF